MVGRMLLRIAAAAGLASTALVTVGALAGGCGAGVTASPPEVPFVALDDAGTCGVTTRKFPVTTAVHVEQGSKLDYNSNPPCGGNHYPYWGAWRSHPLPMPRGNWMHNLEHGGVVFLYRCASRAACPDLAAKLEALAASLPADPICEAPIRNRIVITPDPELPEGVTIAASAWGYTLVARCVDEKLLGDFYRDHTGRAPEVYCGEGSYYADVDGGVVGDAVMDAPVSEAASDTPADGGG